MTHLIQLFLCLHLLMPAVVQAETSIRLIKDPTAYPLSQYGFILALSLLGGVASWYGKVKKGELQASNLNSLVGELTTSALAGLLSFYICEWRDVPPVLTAAIVGVAGHMGTRGISILEEIAQRYIERKAKP